MQYKLLLSNIDSLHLLARQHSFKCGPQLNELYTLHDHSLLVGNDGLIKHIAPLSQLQHLCDLQKVGKTIDCKGRSVIPGFVDAHTHALFAGDRSAQFNMKLEGKQYMQISQAGLGIKSNIKAIRESTQQQLEQGLKKRLDKMIRLGTTTVQIKSGFGMDTELQLKMLRVISKVKKTMPINIVSTYLGAHIIPTGATQQSQLQDILLNQIPSLQKAMLSQEVDCQFIDVFCQKGVFGLESTKQIIEAGRKIGLKANIHIQQLNYSQSGIMAAEAQCWAVSHLEHLSLSAVKALALTRTAGVLLPTTQHIQKLKIPPVRQMIENGMIVALGTDFCPNAFCYSMPLTVHLACRNYGLKVNQSISACTINSAYALNMESRVGSIEVGKQGSMLIIEGGVQRIAYEFGDNPIQTVIIKGQIY